MKNTRKKINKDNFPYKFYLCWWIDPASDSAWQDIEEIKKQDVGNCVTSGWLISKTKKKYKFVGDIIINDDGTITQAGNSTVIPASNIIELVEIKECLKYY
tara:strand:+ start:6569 stop:6871 length:303 start_codon:yes stop_codon:yes gene_type:complete